MDRKCNIDRLFTYTMKTPMGQHQPLLRWILLLDLNIPLLKKKIEREGGITGLSEVTVM